MAMNRLILIICDTCNDITTHQGEPSITMNCHLSAVGHWKLGSRS